MMEDKNNLPELPKGWVWARLGEIGQLIRGVSYKKEVALKEQKEGYIPILRANNIDISLNFDDLIYVPREKVADQQLVEALDIIIAMSSGSKNLVGKAAQAIQYFNGGFGTFCGLFRSFDILDKKFIGFFFQSPEYRSRISNISSGVNINNLRREHVENMDISLPPLPEQRRIVAKIEELFTKLDAGVEALKKVKAELKRYLQAVLKYAFEGRLTKEWREAHKGELEPASVLLEKIKEERQKNAKDKFKELTPADTAGLPELPEGWVWTRLGEVSEVVTGTTPSKSNDAYYGKDYPFFKPTDLNAGYYVRASDDGLSLEGIKNARVLPEKSILVTCIGATIGKTGFIRAQGASNQQINTLIPCRNILPEFVYFMCISPQFQKLIMDNASATTLPILNKRRFEILPIPLPPLPEQHKIVEEVESCLSVADEVEKAVEQSLKQSGRLRQSILKKAFKGKLVPQDPSDEPAEKLLERVKEEKARQEAEKKTKGKVPF